MRPPPFDTAQLSLVRTPFDDPDFLFELKHDRFRALAHIWDGNCELISRKRNAYKSFNLLRENLAKLKVHNAVIDGEIVCLDAEGRSIFKELLFRRGCPIFYAFDLLYLNGRDLRQLPLIERKEKLRAIIERSALPDVLCGKFVEGRGVDFVQRGGAAESGRRSGEAEKRNVRNGVGLAEDQEPELHTIGAQVRAIRGVPGEAGEKRAAADTEEATAKRCRVGQSGYKGRCSEYAEISIGG
jgi:ATP dependent DNA ligase domain